MHVVIPIFDGKGRLSLAFQVVVMNITFFVKLMMAVVTCQTCQGSRLTFQLTGLGACDRFEFSSQNQFSQAGFYCTGGGGTGGD